MANMTKEQELNVLRQMQKIQERLKKLWNEDVALSEKKEDISRVKKADFPTDHLKKAEAEKEKELDIVKGLGPITSLLLGAVLGIPCAFTFGFVITLLSQLSIVSIEISSAEFGRSIIIAEIVFGLAFALMFFLLRIRYKTRCKKMEKKYKTIFAEAEKKDDEQKKLYNSAIEKAKAENEQTYGPRIEEIAAETERLFEEFDQISILAKDDVKNLDRIIDKLKSNKADSVEDALQKIAVEDEQKAKEEAERKRKAAEEAERLRKLQEEMKRNSPGTVWVHVTEDGKGKNADVYVDGGYYGSISYATGSTSFQLAPGYHNVSVVIYSQGYSFRSGVESFQLEGGEDVDVYFTLLGYNRISSSHC